MSDLLSDYDYDLPPAAIAQHPVEPRDASRLLVLRKDTGQIEHRFFQDVPDLLFPGDLLVLNDTRVSALRLEGCRESGGKIEFLLMKPLGEGRFEGLARPGRRLKPGSRVFFSDLSATVVEALADGGRVLQFDPIDGLEAKLRQAGSVPLPPYITRAVEDPERYQTVYASQEGSAAAPTAGLHFTPALLAELQERGVELARVTLDVGLDTFRPVQEEDLTNHLMHGERCVVPEATAVKVGRCKGRILAVGTTSVRTLESSALGKRHIDAGTRATDLFIRPGYRFSVIDGMFTNFHMPRTTMLVMISALAGREAVMRAYAEALERGYRFLSFGDAMLIL